MSEFIVLNPEEFVPDRPEINLSELGLEIAVEGLDYGESSIVVERVRQQIGEGVTSRHWPSVECTIPLIARGTEDLPIADPLHRLEAFVAEVQRRGNGWIRRDFSEEGGFSGSVGTPIDAAALTPAQGWSMAHNQFAPGIVLKLSRSPIWYATTEILAGEASGTSVRDLQLEIAELLGTAPGLIRVVVKNEGAEDWRGCSVAIECDDFSSTVTAKPKYEAHELTLKGGAEISSAVAPEVRAVGTVGAFAGGTSGAGFPSGTAAGDLLIMVVESGGATTGAEANTVPTAKGWTEAPLGSQKQGNTRLTVLYRIATGGDPAVEVSNTGNHQIARIIGIKAGTFDPGTPFNISARGTQASTKSVSITGGTTTRDNCLIVACASGNLPDSTTTAEFSAAANASLTSVTERIDNTTAEGDGGAIYAATGIKATKGTYSATTATAVTEAERGVISLAVNPFPEVVKCPALTSGWVTVLSSEIAGVGHMTHVGPRRMAFRVEDVSTLLDDVQWKLEWRQLGAANWVQTQEGSTPIIVSSPVVGAYQVIDIGNCRPEAATTGDQRWEWRVQVRSANGLGKQPLIRDTYIEPTEQWTRVSDISANAVDGEPVALGGTVENATGVGTIAWKAKVSGTMSFAEESKYPTFSTSGESNYLKVSNFGFGSLIPAAATILGVIGRAVPSGAPTGGAIEEKRVRIVIEGAIKAAEDKAGQGGPRFWSTPETRSWGGVHDLWGLGTITRAQVIASNFGIALALGNSTTPEEVTQSISFKRVEMIVAYAEGGNENRISFAGRSVEFSDNGVRRQHITDEVWGDLVPDGFVPYSPPAGQSGQSMRALIVPSVGDFDTRADSATVKPSAKVFYRPGVLFAREAAE